MVNPSNKVLNTNVYITVLLLQDLEWMALWTLFTGNVCITISSTNVSSLNINNSNNYGTNITILNGSITSISRTNCSYINYLGEYINLINLKFDTYFLCLDWNAIKVIPWFLEIVQN
jgi:hypothetical protein